MTIRHLSDDELDLALAGEPSSADAAGHLASCVACRRRRDAFLAAVDGAGGEDPSESTRARVRERAIAAWGAARPRRRWARWAAAAAAVLVLALLPLLRGRVGPTSRLNPDAVLADVDRVLAQDPLSAVAPEDVVNTVVPAPDEGEDEGGWS
jgi:predicted anti-sigma-YlaC factor YlaD